MQAVPRPYNTRSQHVPVRSTATVWVTLHGKRTYLPPGAGTKLSPEEFLCLKLPPRLPSLHLLPRKPKFYLSPGNPARLAHRAAYAAAVRERLQTATPADARHTFPLTKAEHQWIHELVGAGASDNDICEYASYPSYAPDHC